MVVIVCGSVYCGRPQYGAQLVVSPRLLQNDFYDFYVALFNIGFSVLIETHGYQGSGWISSIMTRAAAWWPCLQRGLLLNTDDCWLSQFKWLYCTQHNHHVSLYIDCCFACFTTYLAHLLSEIIKRCFWFAQTSHPHPPSCLLSPPIPLCFHFSSQEVIYCQTHSNSQPQLHTVIYPNRPCAFIFPIFPPPFFFCHVGTSQLQPLFFQVHLFIGVSVFNSQPQAVLSILASLCL